MTFDLSDCLMRAMTSVRSPSFRGAARRSASVLACLALLPVNGCLGHHYVKTDFKSYENAFAETSNRELLLNLARLENRDPAYFFKMGQITSSYRMQGSLTTNGQLTSSNGAVQIPTGGGTPGVIFENDPTFQFIPVNDDTNARLLMAPIQPDTFYALYEQGWRLDQLFRLLVDRIEVTSTDKNGVCSVEAYRNLAPMSDDGEGHYDALALSHYVTFLRVSALVYELQRSGILVLRGTERFVPYDPKAIIPNKGERVSPPIPGSPEGAASASAGGNGGDVVEPKDEDAAVARQDTWEPQMSQDGKTQLGWILGHKVFSAVFYLNPMTQAADGTYSSNPKTVKGKLQQYLGSDNQEWQALNTGEALDNMLAVMSGGFSLEGTPRRQSEAEDICPQKGEMTAHLYMRSIIEIMAASAQEEVPFEALIKNDPVVPNDPQNRDPHYTPQPFTAQVPKIEQVPVLRLRWKGVSPENLTDPLVSLVYRNTTYRVADEKPDASPPPLVANATWNRDMFRLIEGLSSQVTVDISKFPLPEILQLHSN
jgi:hypothetical protein